MTTSSVTSRKSPCTDLQPTRYPVKCEWLLELIDPGHAEPPLTGACRARHCAGMTIRQRGGLHTMALPGNPRGRTPRCTSPSFKGGRRRASSVVAALPLFHHATALLVRRWDAGPPRRPRRPELRVGPSGSGTHHFAEETNPPATSGDLLWGVRCTGSGLAHVQKIDSPAHDKLTRRWRLSPAVDCR